MATTNTILQIADEIYFELGNPDDTSIAAVSYWLRSNIGGLNSKLSTGYEIQTTSPFNVTPEIGENEKIIFKKLYMIYYYTKFINANLGASAFSVVLEYQSDGDSIKRINRNEVAKTYLQLRKQLVDELKVDLKDYKIDSYTPLQVAGNDDYGVNCYPRELGVNRRGEREST